MTNSSLERASVVTISSIIPSAKYSCSGSLLRLAKGITAIEVFDGSGGGSAIVRAAAGSSPAAAATSSTTLASTLRQAGVCASPRQPERSAHWI